MLFNRPEHNCTKTIVYRQSFGAWVPVKFSKPGREPLKKIILNDGFLECIELLFCMTKRKRIRSDTKRCCSWSTMRDIDKKYLSNVSLLFFLTLLIFLRQTIYFRKSKEHKSVPNSPLLGVERNAFSDI